MVAYYVGDIPSEDLLIEPARNGEAFDLAPFDSADVVFRDPDGAVVASSGFAASIIGSGDEKMVDVEWPGESVLLAEGLYSLTPILHSSTDGYLEHLEPVAIVAQEDNGWQTIDSARREWTTGAPDDDAQLYRFLEAAKQQCVEFAPALELGQRPPATYSQAQIMQARNTFNSMKTDPSVSQDGQLFVIRPYPMDKTIQLLLRPKHGKPVMA